MRGATERANPEMSSNPDPPAATERPYYAAANTNTVVGVAVQNPRWTEGYSKNLLLDALRGAGVQVIKHCW